MARRPKKSEEIDTPEEVEAIEPSESVESNADETSAGEDEVGAARSACGGILAASRVAQSLSVKDVAKQLRLSSTQIEALEQDNFASLPEATIVKGFIRNYAKLLKIPAEPLTSAYAQMVPVKDDYSFALNPGINMKITESGPSHKLRYFLMLAAILLGGGAWYFYQSYVQKPNPVNPIPEIVENLPELALPMSERVQEGAATQIAMPGQADVPVGSEASIQSDKSTTEVLSEAAAKEKGALAEEKPVTEEVALIAEKTLKPQEATKPETVGAEVAASEAAVTDTPPAVGKTRFSFTATQETWLSVVNTSGKEVFSKILYAGGREVVDVRNPSEIVVGNAHGATLQIDGKVIDLAPYTRVNVARVRMNRLR